MNSNLSSGNNVLVNKFNSLYEKNIDDVYLANFLLKFHITNENIPGSETSIHLNNYIKLIPVGDNLYETLLLNLFTL